MKRTLWLLLTVALTAATTYLTTTWHYEVGIFAANNVRDAHKQESSTRKWAQPLAVTGLPNLHRVSEDLYRGAQPQPEGFANLKKLGVKAVVDLRTDSEDTPAATVHDLKTYHLPLSALHAPADRDVVEFLKIVSDPKNLPLYVHCRQGADRTGMMCAIYRVAIQGWSRQAATDEMTRGGFGYHASFESLLRYVQTADLDQLLRQARLVAKPETRPALIAQP